MKTNWKNQLVEWLNYLDIKEKHIQIINSSKEGVIKDKLFYISTYDLAWRISESLEAIDFNFVIADECHQLKNDKSRRAGKIIPMIQKSRRLLLLSGTPILAKPCEAFHVVTTLRPDIFPNFKSYGERFCDPKITAFGREYSGVSNTKELHCVISNMSIRRLKKNVLKDLPEKKRQKIVVECDQRIVREIKKYLNNSRLKTEFKKVKETTNEKDSESSEDDEKRGKNIRS